MSDRGIEKEKKEKKGTCEEGDSHGRDDTEKDWFEERAAHNPSFIGRKQ